MDWHGWLTVAILLITFLVLALELLPAEIALLLSGIVLVFSGLIEIDTFLSGFDQRVIFTLAMLFIVSRVLEVNGIMDLVSTRLLPAKVTSVRMAMICLFPVGIFSAFFNNTPIVLLMTPVVIKWALQNNISPSKLLIPLSFITIMGGTCTLIGTSSNLVAADLLARYAPGDKIGFFEFSYVAGPLLGLGLITMLLVAARLLPDRIDPKTAITHDAADLTFEFILREEAPLVNETVLEATRRFLRKAAIIQVERGVDKIDSPAADLILRAGDRIICTGDVESIAAIGATRGVESAADRHFQIDPSSAHFSELIVPINSTLVGNTLKKAHFRSYCGGSVLSIYREGKRVPGIVGDIILKVGDALMVLSNSLMPNAVAQNRNMFYLVRERQVPIFHLFRGSWVILLFGGMILAASLGVPIIYAATAAAVLAVATRCISLREMRDSIRWDLLILIGAAASLEKALTATGVASYLSLKFLSLVGDNPYMIVGGIFLITMIVTELITNVAAILLIFPMAYQATVLAGYDSPNAVKAIAITVAIASSCSFLTPIGYQTNTIVYSPGGYKFADFFKFGFILSLVYLAGATLLIPRIWPF